MRKVKKKWIISFAVFASISIGVGIGVPVGIHVETNRIINNSIIEIKKEIQTSNFDLLYTKLIENLYPKQIINRYIPKLDEKNNALNTQEKVANLNEKYYQSYNKKIKQEDIKQKNILNKSITTAKWFLTELLSQSFSINVRLAILSFLNKIKNGEDPYQIIKQSINSPDFKSSIESFFDGWINSDNIKITNLQQINQDVNNNYSLFDLSIKFFQDVFQINFTHQELKVFLFALKSLLFQTPQKTQTNNNFIATLFEEANKLNEKEVKINNQKNKVSVEISTLFSNIFKATLNSNVVKFVIFNFNYLYKELSDDDKVNLKSSITKFFQSKPISKQFYLALEPQIKIVLPNEFKPFSDDITTVLIQMLSNLKTYIFLFNHFLKNINISENSHLSISEILAKLLKQNAQKFFNLLDDLEFETDFAPGTLASIAFIKLKPEFEKIAGIQNDLAEPAKNTNETFLNNEH